MEGRCNYCGSIYEFDDVQYIGQEAECPNCNAKIIVARYENKTNEIISRQENSPTNFQHSGHDNNENVGQTEEQGESLSFDDLIESNDNAVSFIKQTISDKPEGSSLGVTLSKISAVLMVIGWVLTGVVFLGVVGGAITGEEQAVQAAISAPLVLLSIPGTILGFICLFFDKPGIKFKLQPNEQLFGAFAGTIYLPKYPDEIDVKNVAKTVRMSLNGKNKKYTVRVTNLRLILGEKLLPPFITQFWGFPLLEDLMLSQNVDIELVKGDILDVQRIKYPILHHWFHYISIIIPPVFIVVLFRNVLIRLFHTYYLIRTKDEVFVIFCKKKYLRDWLERQDNIVMQGDSLTNL